MNSPGGSANMWPQQLAAFGVTAALLTLAAGCATAPAEATAPLGGSAEATSVSHRPDATPTVAQRSTPSASPDPTPEPIIGTELGQRAPELSLTTTEGASLSLADLRGRPVWLVFWAPGCPSCVTEMRMMETMYRAHRASGLEIVGIAVSGSPTDAAGFGDAVGITYPLAVDASAAVEESATVEYQVFVLPTHFWIDRDGIVRAWALGDAPPDRFEERLARIVGPGE